MTRKFIIGSSIAALIAVPALAMQGGAMQAGPDGHGKRPGMPTTRAEVQQRVSGRFAAIDANRDGAVTQAEFDAHREAKKAEWTKKRAERQEARFAALDANKDGQLSKAEFTAPRDRLAGDKADGQRGDGRWGDRAERGGHHGWGMRGGRGGWGGKSMMAGGWFERLDANKDGKVTLAEATKPALDLFDKIDTNKDGTISAEEHQAARDARRAEWQARKG